MNADELRFAVELPIKMCSIQHRTFHINNSRSNVFHYSKVTVHQTSMNANGKTLSILRFNATDIMDSGFYTCRVIRNSKRNKFSSLGTLNLNTKENLHAVSN